MVTKRKDTTQENLVARYLQDAKRPTRRAQAVTDVNHTLLSRRKCRSLYIGRAIGPLHFRKTY